MRFASQRFLHHAALARPFAARHPRHVLIFAAGLRCVAPTGTCLDAPSRRGLGKIGRSALARHGRALECGSEATALRPRHDSGQPKQALREKAAASLSQSKAGSARKRRNSRGRPAAGRPVSASALYPTFRSPPFAFDGTTEQSVWGRKRPCARGSGILPRYMPSPMTPLPARGPFRGLVAGTRRDRQAFLGSRLNHGLLFRTSQPGVSSALSAPCATGPHQDKLAV
jgi:hypothetical protein